MVVWALTAGIGIYLLAVGFAAQRAAAGGQATAAAVPVTSSRPRRVQPRYESVEDNDPDDAGSTDTAGAGTENVMVTGTAALATVLGGQQVGAEQPRADRPSADRPSADRPSAAPRSAAEESALLEFLHPALALLGLTIWIFFMVTGDRLFAWIAFGVVVATVAAGVSWEAARRKHARARERAAAQQNTSFPPHLIMLHGLAAVCTFALVVIAAVVAGHG
jgi:hypothetical protein